MKKLLFTTLLMGALAGCGGGDGGGPIGGNGTGNGSGQGGGNPPVTEPTQTPVQKVAALETSGAIPQLERTASVSGGDTNTNGVRDDIDAYITSQYSSAPQRAAAQQMAKALQKSLLVNPQDINAVKSIDREISRGINCIYAKFDGANGSQPPAKVAQVLESLTTNTKERLLAYLNYNKALDGTSSALPEGDSCE